MVSIPAVIPIPSASIPAAAIVNPRSEPGYFLPALQPPEKLTNVLVRSTRLILICRCCNRKP
jgi:hypothetical protein